MTNITTTTTKTPKYIYKLFLGVYKEYTLAEINFAREWSKRLPINNDKLNGFFTKLNNGIHSSGNVVEWNNNILVYNWLSEKWEICLD